MKALTSLLWKNRLFCQPQIQTQLKNAKSMLLKIKRVITEVLATAFARNLAG